MCRDFHTSKPAMARCCESVLGHSKIESSRFVTGLPPSCPQERNQASEAMPE
jgi:hypothetical protein